jgi:hypothetical protein
MQTCGSSSCCFPDVTAFQPKDQKFAKKISSADEKALLKLVATHSTYACMLGLRLLLHACWLASFVLGAPQKSRTVRRPREKEARLQEGMAHIRFGRRSKDAGH